MENTEQAGGTRYSAGKPIACWAPWLGLDYVYDVARTARDNPLYITDAEDGADEIELQVESIYQGLRSAMRNPLVDASDGRLLLAHVAYLTLDLLHRAELAVPGAAALPSGGLPVFGMRAVLDVSVSGAEKYAPLDWVNGQSFTTLLSCAMRHCEKMVLYGPAALDQESDHKHAGHLAWNVLAILDFVAQGRAQELDNVTPWHGVTAQTRKRYQITQRSTAYEILLAKSIEEQHSDKIRQVAQQIQYRDSAREHEASTRIGDAMIAAAVDALATAHPDLAHTALDGVSVAEDRDTRGALVAPGVVVFDGPVPPDAEGYGPPQLVR